jgi:lon-related putative ATP-dependent protease
MPEKIMLNVTRLNPEKLYQHCDLNTLKFKSTAELQSLPTIIGQSRALEAVDFGVNIDSNGYNLFVMGAAGSGKYTLVKRFLDEHVKNRPTGQDWGYLHNFSNPQMPWVVSVPAGQGKQLRHDIEKVIHHLTVDLPHVFDDEYYRGRMRTIEEAARKHRVRLFGVLQQESDRKGIVLLRMQDGSYAFAAKRDGEAMTADEFEELPVDQQEQTEDAIATLHEDLLNTLLELREWERDNHSKVTALNDEVATEVISREMDKLKHAYPNNDRLQHYFEEMKKDLLNNLDLFLKPDEEPDEPTHIADNAILKRYQINLIVDNSDNKGAPIIYENLPSHQSLLGCVENMAMMGALITDFSLIKAGAIHRANGGYLILDVEQLLMQPYAWEGLKRALQAKELRFDTLEQMYSLVATVSLEPEPMPLDLKVILLGDRHLYYELYDLDPEFAELFKVVADFEENMDRSDDNHELYARLIASTVQREDLLHLDKAAVGKIIEQASRSIEDNQKVSLHLGWMNDLLRESNFWAKKRQAVIIEDQDVLQALKTREQRVDRVRGELYQHIERNITQVNVAGMRVGQVNALSVLSAGQLNFGQPSRLTANCRFGDGDIIDIEREVELGGDLHSKGMLIMSGYLGSTYAKDKPLSMSASLVFEQNYGEVDGDSATVAELCALLSAIAELPLKQSLAITGSMNQCGDVQAIGGVNEKIEGFFDVCKMQGLTGEQGVIIPHTNVQHLMLSQDVIDAVQAGQFHIHAVEHVNQALSLLSGLEMGRLDDNDEYPEGSFNAAIAQRLQLWIDVHKHEKEPDTAESDSTKH